MNSDSVKRNNRVKMSLEFRRVIKMSSDLKNKRVIRMNSVLDKRKIIKMNLALSKIFSRKRKKMILHLIHRNKFLL